MILFNFDIDITHMKCIFRLSYFYCLLRSTLCCEFFDNTISENLLDFVSDYKEENTYITSDNNYFDHADITMFDYELNFPLLTFEHSCLADKDYVKNNGLAEKQDISVFCDKQRELINKIMIFFSEVRECNEWKDLNELLDLKFLLESFLFLTIAIRSKMFCFFKNHLDIYDENMNSILKSMKCILKIKSEIINNLKRKKSNLAIYACLKLEIKNINKFHSETKSAYQHCKRKRVKILKNILNLKESFKAAIDFIKNISNLFEVETFTDVKETLLIVFNMFNKNQNGSIYDIDELIKKTIMISLKKISKINNSMNLFINANH